MSNDINEIKKRRSNIRPINVLYDKKKNEDISMVRERENEGEK